ESVPGLWIAAPLTGLLVQPVIGYLSDRTWTRWGRLKGMQVALNVQNLFDKEYIASCSGESWCWFGYQRSIKASLRYRW
uniref:hypothetical protein n=1 Tax=Achromobacter sp. TaxID=134375 RepID=UPI0031DA2C3C